MRRISRIDRSVDLLRVRANTRAPSPYLCCACKQRTTSFSTTALRTASNNPGFTEKLRRKIWGTDNPPGAEDPYSKVSALDQANNNAARQTREVRESTKVRRSADYQPADTWDGLEEVGGATAYSRSKIAEEQFESFLPPHLMNDTAEITSNLRRAIVEVLAQRQAGQQAHKSTAELGEDLTRNVQLGYSSSGLILDFGSQERYEYLIQSLAPSATEVVENDVPTESEEDVAADRSTQDPLAEVEEAADLEDPNRKALTETSATSYEELVDSWDPSWLQIPLDNPEVKFAILKRTLQLTGIRLSDALISTSNTAQALLSHMVIPPKPRKLVDRLSQREDLMTLPNIAVFAKRITPIDKEKTIGRWKIIAKELEARGLPVTGQYTVKELEARAKRVANQ